jgi:hypothetical protein
MTTTPPENGSYGAAVKEIAAQLSEQNTPLIHRVVTTLGQETALALMKQAQEIEANGGMLTVDGSRRRTPGGVFFQIVRQRTTGAQRIRIFGLPPNKKPEAQSNVEQSQQPRSAAQPQPKAPQLPAFTWDERIAIIEEIGNEKGRANTVKITLIGTLGKYKEQGQCIVGIMQHTGEKFPALPKGVPAPQPIKTNYVVYISSKQFKTVAAAANDPEDALIVEGFPQVDGKTGAISVFASQVTSKKLQAAKRQG